MATIVTRAGKGSPLTHNEVDANFNNLNSDKVEAAALGSAAYTDSTDYATAAQGALADSALQSGDNISELVNDAGYITTSYSDADVDSHLNTGTASSGEVLSWTGTDYDWIAAGGGSALQLYAENPSSPTAPSATGTNAVAIGSGTIAQGANDVVIGTDSDTTTLGDNVAIGNNARGQNLRSLAIGYFARSGNRDAISIGSDSYSFANEAMALGHDARAGGTQAVALTDSYASGADSFAAAIANNTATYGATGANSVAIGKTSKATNSGSVSFGKELNISSGVGSIVSGGAINTSSGDYAFTCGFTNTASQNYTWATGQYASATIIGKSARASGRFSANGDAQAGEFVLRADTTDAVAEPLTTDASVLGPSASNQIILPNNSAHAFYGTIVARQQASAGTACAAWKIEGLIRREGSAGTTVLVNSATTVLDNTPAWGMALTADTTNGGLKIEVTGAAATNIRWVATVHTSEVTY